eukprot:CAMPEP_0197443838 /NCGR_PEP_ID=MMETSP1175-20131217/9476_1 /TAXON_ID=1003142 /ORGANISM="Triceratium dubium, Strain CCMP147" /LENGTH=476 /DNA_ID=CAMNT_0042974529 /DNA_START=127 /DNA_END=1557 /DNA_ORIENTATION=-
MSSTKKEDMNSSRERDPPSPQVSDNSENPGSNGASQSSSGVTLCPISVPVSSLTSSKSRSPPSSVQAVVSYFHNGAEGDVRDLKKEKELGPVSLVGRPSASLCSSAAVAPLSVEDTISLEKESDRSQGQLPANTRRGFFQDKKLLAAVLFVLALVTAVAAVTVFFSVWNFSGQANEDIDVANSGNLSVNDDKDNARQDDEQFTLMYTDPFSMKVVTGTPDDYSEEILLGVTKSHLEHHIQEANANFRGLVLDFYVKEEKIQHSLLPTRHLIDSSGSGSKVVFTSRIAQFNGAIKITNGFFDSSNIRTARAITQVVIVRAFSPPNVDEFLQSLRSRGMPATLSVLVYDWTGILIGNSGVPIAPLPTTSPIVSPTRISAATALPTKEPSEIHEMKPTSVSSLSLSPTTPQPSLQPSRQLSQFPSLWPSGQPSQFQSSYPTNDPILPSSNDPTPPPTIKLLSQPLTSEQRHQKRPGGGV